MTQRPPNPPAPVAGPQIPIELPDSVAEGQYSNLMFITHSPSEFVLDFARMLPGARKGIVYSRIIMTPQHAKLLHELLERNLKAYEEQHGAIKTPGRTNPDPRIGFSPTPPAEPNAARD